MKCASLLGSRGEGSRLLWKGERMESHISSEKKLKSIQGHAHEPVGQGLRNGIPVARYPKIWTDSSPAPLDIATRTAQSSVQIEPHSVKPRE